MDRWKGFCEETQGVYDQAFPYTVGPPAKVIRFYKEKVLNRTYSKHIPINADMRIQIGLGSNEASTSFAPTLME
ncbi:hypothetical protein BGZ65_011611, partial [Modicella reniformis]